MTDDLAELYQELILDHSRSPRNFRVLAGYNHMAQGDNPICGDNYTLYAVIDGNVIREIAFQGSGCAISKASASILTESLKGKTVDEAKAMFAKVRDMVTTGHTNGDLGKITALAGVHKFPARVKCAVLPWHAIIAAIDGDAKTVTTESED
jgi:nitrogen fixation NifU-like protein